MVRQSLGITNTAQPLSMVMPVLTLIHLPSLISPLKAFLSGSPGEQNRRHPIERFFNPALGAVDRYLDVFSVLGGIQELNHDI